MRFFALLLLLFFTVSNAYFGRENEGLAVFGWASLLQSPRSVSIEGAGSAFLSQDYGATLMNPALLIAGKGIGAGGAWQIGDLADRQGLLAFSHNFLNGRMQHTYGVVDNGEVEHYNEQGEKENVSSYPMAQYYAITTAFELKHFKIGVTGRYLWERLSEHSKDGIVPQIGMGLALDWGLLWNSNSARYGLALMGRYLGQQIRPFVKGGVNGYALASELALGTFWRPNTSITWFFECNAPRYSPAVGKLGLEYRFAEPLAIRAGIQRSFIDVGRYVRSFFDSEENAPKASYYRMFSLGAGYRIKMFTLDYSYSMLVEGMGNEQRFGISGNF